MYTVEQIKDKVQTNQAWLERAILALYKKQTFDEQKAGETKIYNNQGFNKPDGNKMSYYARWIKSGKHLTGRFKEDAQRRIEKYMKQLLKIANEKNKSEEIPDILILNTKAPISASQDTYVAEASDLGLKSGQIPNKFMYKNILFQFSHYDYADLLQEDIAGFNYTSNKKFKFLIIND